MEKGRLFSAIRAEMKCSLNPWENPLIVSVLSETGFTTVPG